jgi:DNA-binding NtrC family response regulator
MDGQKRILLVSRDPMVLQTRKLMLGAYFEVSAACRVLEAKKLLAEQPFDLMVFCYTLTDDDCEAIMNAARLHSRDAKILTLTVTGYAAGHARINSYFLAAEDGPFILVKKSAELLGFEFRSKGRMVRAARPEGVAIAPHAA